jgi:D-alanyl-D-alanine carboxypeptidase
MRLRFCFLTAAAMLLLSGCQKSSDHFLSYQETVASEGYSSAINLSEYDFFGKNLVIIPKEEVTADSNTIESEAALLIDVTAGKSLFAKNIYEQLYPASLTKLYTALVALKRGEITDTVTISYQASHIPDPYAKKCGFEEGDTMSLETLLNCLLVYSGNDAAIAIAEHIGGSEEQFVSLMNEEAKKLGAVHTHFVNPTGLHDDNQYTSAYDVYLAFQELMKYDAFLNIISQSTYTAEYKDMRGNAKEKTFLTTNGYLKESREMPEGLIMKGGKSGNTYKSGHCLVVLVQDENNSSYISIIMKAKDEEKLYSEMSKLYSVIQN